MHFDGPGNLAPFRQSCDRVKNFFVIDVTQKVEEFGNFLATDKAQTGLESRCEFYEQFFEKIKMMQPESPLTEFFGRSIVNASRFEIYSKKIFE